MAHQKDQQPGGPGVKEGQEPRKDQANPGQPGGDRDREQKSGQPGREQRPDQSRPEKGDEDPSRSKPGVKPGQSSDRGQGGRSS